MERTKRRTSAILNDQEPHRVLVISSQLVKQAKEVRSNVVRLSHSRNVLKSTEHQGRQE